MKRISRKIAGAMMALGIFMSLPSASGLADAETVIESLDSAALPAGKHYFYFKAGWRAGGNPLLVPVMVLKGAKAGPRLMLTAAVHGDELNGIRVIHRLFDETDYQALAGTIIAVPGLNQPGLVANSRYYVGASGDDGVPADINRKFPGRQRGGGTADRFVGQLWAGLMKENTDLAVDLHTQTTGTSYPLFVFADFKNRKARDMAFALLPDIIKNDAGQKGTVETSFMESGIPAVTYEVGSPMRFQADMIARATAGLRNLMVRNGMLAGEAAKPSTAPFVGVTYTDVRAEAGGVAVLQVGLLDTVEKGQLVATLYDPFGREIGRYVAPHGGRVLAVATNPLADAGTMLVRILR